MLITYGTIIYLSRINKRLKFFDKDLIPWKDHPYRELYKSLFTLRKNNQAYGEVILEEKLKLLVHQVTRYLLLFGKKIMIKSAYLS